MTEANVEVLLAHIHDGEETVRVPGHWIREHRERIGPIHEPSDNHSKPEVGVVRVRGAPVVCSPAGGAVVLAPYIAETVLPEDWVIRPWRRFAVGAAIGNGFTFANEICQNCASSPLAPPAKERWITRWEYEHILEAIQRREMVEHPFGTIKARRERVRRESQCS